jgi:hypothetical protein
MYSSGLWLGGRSGALFRSDPSVSPASVLSLQQDTSMCSHLPAQHLLVIEKHQSEPVRTAPHTFPGPATGMSNMTSPVDLESHWGMACIHHRRPRRFYLDTGLAIICMPSGLIDSLVEDAETEQFMVPIPGSFGATSNTLAAYSILHQCTTLFVITMHGLSNCQNRRKTSHPGLDSLL